MKTSILFLLLVPYQLWAQADTLKPIGTDLIPGNGRYGPTVRAQYTYNGVDVRRTHDLEKYIRASGNADANTEYDRYLTRQSGGKAMIVAGSIIALVGVGVMRSHAPDSDGKFTTTQPVPPSTLGVYYTSNSITTPDEQKENAYAAGVITLLGGAVLTGIGVIMQYPGKHVRHAVQYYNRALKQRGISWQMQPYAGWSSSGVGLVGKF